MFNKGVACLVTFELIENTDSHITYRYYPEDHKDKEAGIIELDIKSGSIKVLTPAGEDFLSSAASEEVDHSNLHRNNQRYWFAEHAISKIADAFNTGNILEDGIVAWY